jgi:hypothetical protein
MKNCEKLALMCVAAMAATMISCDPVDEVEQSGGKYFDKHELTLRVGETETISLLQSVSGLVLWESSDTGVATVDQSGLVTAEGEGTADITFKVLGIGQTYVGAPDPNHELDRCRVTVLPGEPEPDDEPNSSRRLVSNITLYEYMIYDGGYGGSVKESVTTISYGFTYDNHSRLTKVLVTHSDDDEVEESFVTYPDASTIVITNNDFVINLTLNTNGYIASASNDEEYYSTYSYADGYLQKETAPTTITTYEGDRQEDGTVLNEEEIEHTGTYTFDYTWNGGNPVSVVEKEEFPTLPGRNQTRKYTYTYGGTLNKPCGFDLATIFAQGSTSMMPRG